MISRPFSFFQKILHRKWSYIGISFLCFAFLFNIILPGREVHAAAEVISCNAGGDRTLSVGTYTDSDGSQFSEGADLTLNVGTGADCTFILNLTETDATINISSLTLESGVTLTHNVASSVESTYNRLAFNVTGDVTINSGASIDVDGKGYLGGWQSDVGQQGRTEGNVAGSDFLSGGSHGGRGGSSSGASEYDSVSNPTLPGGGGAGGFGDSSRVGGNGGGVIRITATNIIVNGTLSAEGIPTAIATGPYSGGAGGTIYLHASGTISGNGTLSAASGDDPSLFTDGGKGGGGRIALHYANLTFSGTLTAHGGKSAATIYYTGAAGTIYKKPAAQAYGDLTIDNNNNSFDNSFSKPTTLSASITDSDQVAMFGGAYVFNSITVQNYGVLNISSALDAHSDGTTDSARKLYVSSCTVDNDDLSDGEIQYNTTPGSGVNADYTCVSPEYVLGFSSTSDTDLESVSSGSFNIVGSGPVSSEVTFDYAIKAASTTASGAGSDYTLLNGTGTILVGDSSTTIPFTIVNDTEQETDEIFVVEISNPSVGAVLGANVFFTYTIIDEDTPGITFNTGGSIDVNEGFGNDTYTVVLDSPPTSDVTISLTGDADVNVSPSTLTFTSENWLTPQTVTVTAVDDNYFESSHSGTISYAVSSADTNYNNFSTSPNTVNISDNDSANITINAPGDDIVSENGLTDTYTIILTSIPTADVTITITPDADTQVDVASLVFTPDNWNVPQTVTVSAVDDADVESSEFASISHSAASTDMNFMGASLNSASFTVIDNETASVSITQSGGATSVREGSSPDTYTINLEKEPTSDVIITPSTFSSDISLSPETLTFTSVNWLTPQTVTISAVDDDTFEGSEFVSISHGISSGDADYNSLFLNGLNFNVLDNDGFTLTESGGTTNVTEGGATDSYTIVLNENPFSNVSLALSTSTQYTLSTSTVVFTSSNWDTPQTVTVTAVDDATNEGNHTATVTSTITTFAFKYSNTALPTVTVNITDNDTPTPGVTITESSGTTTLTEAGTTDSYTVVLDTEPTANVVVTVTPDADSTVASSPLTFTSLNWDTPQTITVTAVDDDIDEDGDTSTITHSAASSDLDYNGIAIGSVVASITDNDTAGFTVGAISGSTSEAGATATFTVRLNSEPTADVSVSLSSSDTTEGTVSPASLIFTSLNWDTPQTVTVTGVNDFLVDGSIVYSIVLAAATSADGHYNTVNPSDVSVTNTDNDIAGITVGAASGNTSESGGTANFTVVLDTKPTANVEIGVASSDMTEGTALPVTLIFTTDNWDTPQTITVTGADDTDIDGTVAYTITLSAATSADNDYDTLNPDDVVLSNSDNDSVDVVVEENSGGGAGTLSRPNLLPFSEAQSRIQEVVLSNDSPVIVRIGSVVHHITRVSASPLRATIIVESHPITLSLNKGETKTLDTDDNKIDDLQVTYLGFIGKNPEFSFKDLTSGALTEEKRFFSINNNLKITNTRKVILNFNLEKITEMVISNKADFSDSTYQPYLSSIDWELSEGAGTKTVYARFRNKSGATADTHDTIVYDPQSVPLDSCHHTGKAWKTSNSSAVYLIGETHDAQGNVISTACAKRVFPNSTLYFSYFSSWKDLQVVSQSELDAIPFDTYSHIPYGPRFVPSTGTLLKAVSDPKVYVVFAGQKHWIETEVVFRAAGFMFNWVKEVVNSVFDTVPTGESVNSIKEIPKEVKSVNPVVSFTSSSPILSSPSVSFTQFMGKGSTGEDVRNLQVKLKTLGYLQAEATGYYGLLTVEAVKAFQKDHNIDQKGHVGPATREALNNL